MSLYFIDGFDHYAAATSTATDLLSINRKYNNTTLANGYYSFPVGKDGTGQCLQLAASSDTANRLNIALPNMRNFCVGAWYYWTGGQQCVFFIGGGMGSTALVVRNTGQLSIWSNVSGPGNFYNGGPNLVSNTWNYLEFQLRQIGADSSGYANASAWSTSSDESTFTRNVSLHSIQFFTSGTSANGQSVNSCWLGNSGLASIGGGANIKRYDDFYVSTGERYGPKKVRSLLPNADVQAQWTPSSGSSNYPMISETTEQTLVSNVTTNIDGHQDWYDLDTPSFPVTTRISSVMPFIYYDSPTYGGNDAVLATSLKTSGVEINQVQLPTITSRNNLYSTLPPLMINPNTNRPWKSSEIDDLQLGINAVTVDHDPNAANVYLLADFNNASLSSSTGHDATNLTTVAYGTGSTISSSVTQDGNFGNKSLQIESRSGTNNQTNFIPTAFNQLLAGDFTLECWMRPTSWADTTNLCPFMTIGVGNILSTTMCLTLELPQTGGWIALRSVNADGSDNAVTLLSTPSSIFPVNTWNHISLGRSGNTIRFSANGVSYLTLTRTTPIQYASDANWPTGYPIVINGYAEGTSFTSSFNGNVRDIRLTDGICRYPGTTYTVPTGSFAL